MYVYFLTADVKYNLTADARLTFPETGGSFLQNTIPNQVGNAPTCESHLVLLNVSKACDLHVTIM